MLSRAGAGPGSTALVSLSPREGKYLYLGWVEVFCLESWSACKSVAVVEVGRCSSTRSWVIGLPELCLWLHMLNADVDLFL